MTKYFNVHPENPQKRLIQQTCDILRKGGLILYPTDTTYAFGCMLNHRGALEKMRSLRGITDKHPLTLMCSGISQAAKYAIIDDSAFKYIKTASPGPYTYILSATKLVPKLVHGAKRKQVGIRLPGNPIAIELVTELAEPLLSSTAMLSGMSAPISDPHDVGNALKSIDLVLDAGKLELESTTVVDLISDSPEIIRIGSGDLSVFLP